MFPMAVPPAAVAPQPRVFSTEHLSKAAMWELYQHTSVAFNEWAKQPKHQPKTPVERRPELLEQWPLNSRQRRSLLRLQEFKRVRAREYMMAMQMGSFSYASSSASSVSGDSDDHASDWNTAPPIFFPIPNGL